MTIAAISTAVAEAGIGIVRMSGEDSLEIANKVFKGVKNSPINSDDNRKMLYGNIYDNDEIVDEVLLSYMKAPHTYTREDIVEIYCHGGIIAVRKVLNLLLENGAKIADAGEFTKRAFLNGRIDLAQAEAIMDMISAKTDEAYDASIKQLEGGLSEEISKLREILLNLLARIEASIDYPGEDEIEDVTDEKILQDGEYLINELEKLIESFNRGRILKDGLTTVILGKPNVGKSSLLNSLLRETRAIVTDIPGTTRDTIEEYLNIDGILLKLIDTAGIRDTKDQVEQIGVERSVSLIKEADLIIAVFDSSEELDEEDFEIIELIKDKKAIVIYNKIDLVKDLNLDKLEDKLQNTKIIPLSALEGLGVDILEDEIKEMFFSGEVDIKSTNTVTNIRHLNLLKTALKSVKEGVNAAKYGMPVDCVEVDFYKAWEDLGKILGDTIEDDILDKIFSDFCLGK